MKFISWSLNEPSNTQFAEYATEVAPGEWQILNPDAWKNWGGNQKNFWLAFMNHHDKIYGFGLHDFGVNADGTIYNFKAGEGYPVLNEDETAIRWWMRDSLRFLVDHYPNIKWSLQMVCFEPSRVEPILDNVNGAQDTFVRQLKKIAELYLNRFPGRIKGIEMDFEIYIKAAIGSGTGEIPGPFETCKRRSLQATRLRNPREPSCHDRRIRAILVRLDELFDHCRGRPG